jgi:hypothetical protein
MQDTPPPPASATVSDATIAEQCFQAAVETLTTHVWL